MNANAVSKISETMVHTHQLSSCSGYPNLVHEQLSLITINKIIALQIKI